MTMSISLFGILLITAVLVMIGVVLRLLYKKKVNRALQNEDSMAHISVPDPVSSSKSIAVIIAFLLLFFICFNQISTINNLEKQIVYLSTDQQTQYETLQSQLVQISKDISAAASNIISLSYEITGYDKAADKYMIEYTLCMKEYTSDTEATLYVPYGGEVKTVFDGTCFKGTAACGIWDADPGKDPYLTYSDGQTWKTEKLETSENIEYPGNLVYEMFQMKVFLSGNSEYFLQDGKYDLTAEAVTFAENWKIPDNITAARLVMKRNGDAIGSMDIKEQLNADNPSEILLNNSGFSGKMEDDDSLEMVAEIETENGYSLVYGICQINGSQKDGYSFLILDECIEASRNGELIYSVWKQND